MYLHVHVCGPHAVKVLTWPQLLPTCTCSPTEAMLSISADCIQVRAETKPREKEYIIDVPLALRCSGAGLGWPARAITELRTGSLVQDDVRLLPLQLYTHSPCSATDTLHAPPARLCRVSSAAVILAMRFHTVHGASQANITVSPR